MDTPVKEMKAFELFIEIDMHLAEDSKPSEYFNALVEKNIFPEEYPFSMLTDLKKVPQSPVHHPEGDVWNHTMLVVDNAAERRELSRDPRTLMWAALLHDLGKIPATKLRNGRITAYDHDREGKKLARDFLEKCTPDEGFIQRVCALVRWHMQLLYVTKNLPYSDLKSMARETDIREVALLSFCDRLGRGAMQQKDIQRELKDVERFVEKCSRYSGTGGKH